MTTSIREILWKMADGMKFTFWCRFLHKCWAVVTGYNGITSSSYRNVIKVSVELIILFQLSGKADWEWVVLTNTEKLDVLQ